MTLTDHDRQQLYRYMCLSRAVEDAAWALAGQGRLVGRLYTGHGQEAIPVGAAYALGPEDILAPMYRDMGAHLVRGVRPAEVFAQYFGKRSSSNGGKDSGLHIGDMSRGIIGMISVLPDSLPVAVGAALAFKIRREPRVALTTFGEGATSTGAFHEAVNLAAVQRVPVVLVCENNGWALSTPVHLEVAGPSIAERAPGYGLPGVQVDGNDVEAVYAAATPSSIRPTTCRPSSCPSGPSGIRSCGSASGWARPASGTRSARRGCRPRSAARWRRPSRPRRPCPTRSPAMCTPACLRSPDGGHELSRGRPRGAVGGDGGRRAGVPAG
jgi:hypothetical protein